MNMTRELVILAATALAWFAYAAAIKELKRSADFGNNPQCGVGAQRASWWSNPPALC